MFLNFITFIIISIKGFLSVFIFRPPKPAGKTKLIYTIDLAYRTQMYKTEENLKEVYSLFIFRESFNTEAREE